MSHRIVTFALLATATLSSLATSAPSFYVGDRVGGSFTTDRGADAEFTITMTATEDALPEVEGGFSPQGGGGEGGLTSQLNLELELRTQGTLGFGRTDTNVTVELWMDTPEGDWLIGEDQLDVSSEENGFVSLVVDGVFSTCPTDADCTREMTLVVAQSGDARLKIKHDAELSVMAGLPMAAPKTAEVEVHID